MRKCPECHESVDFMLATHWEGESWHRNCAVKNQIKKIDKLKKKLSSPGISQINHGLLAAELVEAEKDLFCLKDILSEEELDTQKLGKIMTRHGFGPRVDTHQLLERGEITKKMIAHAFEVKQMYSADTKDKGDE